MDDDPWISWKLDQNDDDLHCSGQSHEKPERAACDTKGYAGHAIFFFFFFFLLLSLAAVGSGGVRARPKPAEFPLLRKVPLTSAVSEIFEISEVGRSALYHWLRGLGRTAQMVWCW